MISIAFNWPITGLETDLIFIPNQEKLAWVTDISQCMDNVHFDNLYNNTLPHISSSSVPQFVKSDPSLFKVHCRVGHGFFKNKESRGQLWSQNVENMFYQNPIFRMTWISDSAAASIIVKCRRFVTPLLRDCFRDWRIWDSCRLTSSTRSCWLTESSLMEFK